MVKKADDAAAAKKADGDVQKDEEQKQESRKGATYTLDFSLPTSILAVPLPLHYPLISLPLCHPYATLWLCRSH